MEATPDNINMDALEKDLLSCCSVDGVEDLHVWAIAPGKNIMTVNLITKDHNCCYSEAEEIAEK